MSLLESWSTYHGFSSYGYLNASYSGLHGASMIIFFEVLLGDFLFSFFFLNLERGVGK